MKKICICSVYMGKLPNTIDFWINSIRNNSSIDFVLFTDESAKNIRGGANNLKIDYMTLDNIRERIQQLFDFPIVLDAPYKLCDYKPVYGNAFKDYFEGYDFWGYADLDLVFGDLRYFLTEDILNKYDKIYNQGHLSLYRNCKSMNDLYLRVLPQGKAFDYRFVFRTKHPCFFDEHCGIERIIKYDKEKMYIWPMGIQKGVLADIPPFTYDFTFCYDNKKLDDIFFEYDKGKLYLCSGTNRIPTVYAHFAKRKFSICTDDVNHFKIFPNQYANYTDKYPAISFEEKKKYEKWFSGNFRKMKVKRAFRLGIIKYLEKVIRKRKFLPL